MFSKLMEKIRHGYRLSDSKPARFRFMGDGCFCPLTALAYSYGWRGERDMFSYLVQEKNYPMEFLRGFWRGVDDAGLRNSAEWRLRMAFECKRWDEIAGFSLGREVAYELNLAEREERPCSTN